MSEIIRKADMNDIVSLNKLFTQELEYHKDLLPDMFNVPDELINKSWLDSVLKNENEHIAVLEAEGEIVGAILYKIKSSPNDIIFKERRYGFIQEMIVDSAQRRKGFGTKLMDFALEDLAESGISEIELSVWETNEMGKNFYSNYGFSTVKRWMKVKRD
jgi:ribosomal protein S18 acetylase RimI-like enzyme